MFHYMLLHAFDLHKVIHRIIFTIKEFVLKNKVFLNHHKIYLYYYILS